MDELWGKSGNLIDKREWGKLIDSLKGDAIVSNKEEATLILKERFISAVKERLPEERFGILFSGGVDSSLIAAVCKELGGNFTCYSVGFQDETKEPEDITEAKKVAEELGIELRYKIFNLEEAKEIIKRTVNILKEVGKTDVVNVGVGSVVLAATELAKEDRIKYLFSGLGSEEIFAGYERHGKAKDAHEECWSGLKNMWNRDLVRDFTLSKELGVIIRTPFLDKDLIEYAMQIPAKWKISENEKKIILREVAEEFLGKFAWRKKKAAQYGSCFDKAISKLARKEGFKLKKDWIDNFTTGKEGKRQKSFWSNNI